MRAIIKTLTASDGDAVVRSLRPVLVVSASVVDKTSSTEDKLSQAPRT